MRRLALIAALGLLATPVVARAPAAPAAPGAAPMFGGSNQPIDVTAENSEMFQQEHRQVFWGNVDAVQGTSRLRTPRLTTFFSPRDPNAPKPATPAPNADMGQVERIEAEGPVFYTTPTQRAKGDHATYLASNDTITMTGNVVLVQEKNVATGDKLVIEQKTGHATLTSSAKPGGVQQHVRAVLYPKDNPPPAPGAPPAPAAAKPAGHP